jgi:assimilatory nitrate reductase electron transfer subunit
MLHQHRRRARRVVIVGFGPVAARLVDDLRPAVRDHRLQILVVGAERDAAYNRVMIGELALGRADRDLISLADTEDYSADGIRTRLGATVDHIDREHRYVTLSDGDQYAYDVLVLATGAAARVPALGGLSVVGAGEDPMLPDGITVLRDLRDARRLRQIVHRGGPLVVLGGGVLGMELALTASEEGVDVTLVHTGRVPMERNLDPTAAAIVGRHLRRASVRVVADARAERVITDDGRFMALLLSDGRRVDGGGLLLCCGAAPRTRLAADAGLAVDQGIVVDHDLRSVTDPDVYAIGDCARVRCAVPDCDRCRDAPPPSGLIGPGWAQAEQLARSLTDGGAGSVMRSPSRDGGAVMVLKAPGLSVVSAGMIDADPLDCLGDDGAHRVAQWSDPAQGRYLKMITRGGVLEGMICVGLPRSAAELTLLYENRSELPSDRSALLRHDGPDHASGADISGPEATVCRCNGVTSGRIEAAISEGHIDLAAIGRSTRAGTGCGTCRERICELLQAKVEVVV